MGEQSEFDKGYLAGWKNAANEALWQCKAHIDRLDPGRSKQVRTALSELEVSLRSVLLAQKGIETDVPWSNKE